MAPQSMPNGALVTEPDPFPLALTVSTSVRPNVAVTDVASAGVTVQGRTPEQPPPDQPRNAEPVSAVAVSVTGISWLKSAEQVAPQSMPGVSVTTFPVPDPALATVSVDALSNRTLAVRSWSSSITHAPVPVQSPLQPTNTEPG